MAGLDPLPIDARVRQEQRRRLGVLVGATRFATQQGTEESFRLDLVDLDAYGGAPAGIGLPFAGHGLALRPGSSREAVIFEKRGRGGGAVDLVARRVIKSIEPTAGHAFYGHCAYAPGGNVLFIVETQLGSLEGAISVRDPDTFAVLGTIPTYGVAPHDCHILEDGRTLVVTNGGGPVTSPYLPSVTFIDVNSRALVEQHEFREFNWNAGHVAVLAGRAFAAVSAARDGLASPLPPGGVTLRRCGDSPIGMSMPKSVTSRLLGESLSVAINPTSRVVCATHPAADLVTFWSLDAGALESSLELPQPRGVTMTLDGRFFAVSYGVDARVLLVEALTLRVVTGRRVGAGMLGGAHLYTWTG